MKKSCRQLNDLFKVMQQPPAPSSEWYWRILLDNSVFFPPRTCLTPRSGWTSCDINVTYTCRLLKSAFNWLQFRRWQYGSIFICSAVIAPETREMSRNSKRIWPYISSRSSKVIDLGVNVKPICDFLVVTLAVSATVFEIFRLKDRKTADFTHPSIVGRPRSGEPLRISGWNLAPEI